MEQQQDLETRLEESAERATKLAESLEKMRSQFSEHNESSATRISELDGRRSDLCASIPRPLLSHYDRIRKAKDGRGVVSVYRSSSCGGCFQALPPQKINKVRMMDDLVLCEICGRILITDTLDTKL
jgi:predicted  nucleic acid-binding Zn-ribbon protein